MAEQSWNVVIGAADDQSTGVPPVPATVYEGDEAGARAAYGDFSAQAEASGYRYVMLRNIGEVVELWGTPPAVG